MAQVYRHRRKDTNEIFYVGVAARKDRPYSKGNRNQWWRNVTNKTDYTVEIVADKIPYEDALELECLMISEYGRKDLSTGYLVNLTDGGEGTINFSESTKKRISESKIGKPHKEETKLKISKTLMGRTHNYHTPEVKAKISKANKVSKCKSVILTETGEVFKSVLEASEKTGVHKSNIGRSCRNERPCTTKSSNKIYNFRWHKD